MRIQYRALLGAMLLGNLLAFADLAVAGTHSDPVPAKAERDDEDLSLGEWVDKVKVRKNADLVTGLNSDIFLEREASSAETDRRVAAGKLSLTELLAAWPEGGRNEMTKRLERAIRKAIASEKDGEKHIIELQRIASAKATPAAMKAAAEKLLQGVSAIGWKPLLTKIRDAVAKKPPPKGAAGAMLEKVLGAVPAQSLKDLKEDVETFIDDDATEDAEAAAVKRTKEIITAAVKKLGLVAEERAGTGSIHEMMHFAFRDPKDKSGLTYLIDVVPSKGLDGAIRVRTELALARKDVVSDSTKLPSGEWASKALPAQVPILTDQFATATPGETKKLFEKEHEAEKGISVGEYEWFGRHFPKHKDEIDAAFDVVAI